MGRIDTLRTSPHSPACLLRRQGDDYTLTADIAPVVSPLPEADPAAVDALRSADTVRIVSRWGVDGERGPYVGTFTHHPPLAEHFGIVVAITGDRASLRSTTPDGPRENSVSRDAIAAQLEGASSRHPLLIVTADAGVDMQTLARWLEALDVLHLPLALGLVIHTDRDLAQRHALSIDNDATQCTVLPPLEGGGPIGALSAVTLRDALPALRDVVSHCTTIASSQAVAVGGRLRVGVRIDANARASDVCVTDDSIDDASFRICLVDGIGRMAWPTPSPAGFVDVYLPLVIAPDLQSSHRGICLDSTPSRTLSGVGSTR